MSDYELYYWPIPFRGQFVRALLAFAGRTWSEHDGEEISKLMDGSLRKMPVPFMGPPLLIDNKADFAISQMPAIVLYLGETLNLLPKDAKLRALTLKIVMDANDIIDDITLDGGRLMWTPPRWEGFVPRLSTWMTFGEEIGRRHGLTRKAGTMLGEAEPGVADVVTAILWGTMTDRFPAIKEQLQQHAPMTAALVERVGALPALAELAAKARVDYGDAYCGGRIEASLRKVL
jgi:glutathione S-transferase